MAARHPAIASRPGLTVPLERWPGEWHDVFPDDTSGSAVTSSPTSPQSAASSTKSSPSYPSTVQLTRFSSLSSVDFSDFPASSIGTKNPTMTLPLTTRQQGRTVRIVHSYPQTLGFCLGWLLLIAAAAVLL
jgi:hypothetical protein